MLYHALRRGAEDRGRVRRPPRTRRAALVGGLAATTGILAAADSTFAQERITLEGPRVAIHNVAGQVRIVAGSGSGVVVEVTRGGSDGARLEPERRTLDGVETLVIRYPGDRVVYPRPGHGETHVRVSEDGRLDEGGRRVSVTRRGRGLEAYADLRISVPAGADVALHHGLGEVSATGVEGDLLLDLSSGSVRASGMRGFLNVDTGSGSVEVTDARGDLRIDTGSGSVRVTRASADAILVDTGSGSVDLAEVETGELRVDTGSGSIDLVAVRANDVLLDTGSGGVNVELLERVDNLQIDTASGSVTVQLPADLGAEIEVETGSGGIDVEFPITVQIAERTHLVGRIGDGRGRIVIDTGSGSVRLRRH